MGDTTRIAVEDIKRGMAAGGMLTRKFFSWAQNRSVQKGQAVFYKIRTRFDQCTPTGKGLAIVGSLGMLVMLYLIIFDATGLRIVRSDSLMVTASAANMRGTSSLKSAIKNKVYRGTTLIPLQKKEKWWRVRIEGNKKSGWIHESVVKKNQASQLVWTYQLRYYEWYFIVAAVLLGIGIRLRKVV